jgi:Ca-activated chloride channel homolog
MRKELIGMLLACALNACAPLTTVAPGTVAGSPPASAPTSPNKVAAPSETPAPEPEPSNNGLWIGASGASDFMLAGGGETFLGVWVDVPSVTRKVRAPMSLALVMDTSGSMAGPKIEHARSAARSLVQSLPDGDILSLHTFSDEANERVPPTTLDATTRMRILSTISELEVRGGTNIFDGLRIGASRVIHAPATHAVRRVVMISDGIATVGPTSPEVLGQLASRGADQGVQVTAIGVGLEYDEKTLNALAIKSSGRLYHLAEPKEMASILDREMKLLQGTMATGAFVEVVPAPGVQLLGADGVRADWNGGGLRIPLGAMFGGQHRELLVRVRVTETGTGVRPLASVRLHFRDPAEGNLERVQEVVARFESTTDPLVVERRANLKTRQIMAMNEVAQASARAAAQVNAGQFEAADKDLAIAEKKLEESAKQATNAKDKARIQAQAAGVSAARKSAGEAAAAPPAAKPAKQRASSLEINDRSMDAYGY